MALIIHIDGGARGNPGPAGAGVVIQTDSGELVHEGAYFLGPQTNNAAEYLALIYALRRVTAGGGQDVAIHSDSELLVRQITGQYRVKNAKLAELFEQAQLLLLRIAVWRIQHVRREENARADELANLAMDRRTDVIVYDDDSSAASGEHDATPATSNAESGSEERIRRIVEVSVEHRPTPKVCRAHKQMPDAFSIDSTLPAGLCVHAAHAIVPTVLAVQNTAADEFAAVPTLTVRCTQTGCGASFHVAPKRSSNGTGQESDGA